MWLSQTALLLLILVQILRDVHAQCTHRWIVNGICCYCSGGHYMTASQCCNCQAGRFQNSRDVGEFHNRNSCFQCAAGQYQPLTQQSNCHPCSAGKFSSAGASSCTNCPAGRFQGALGRSTCSNCAAGRAAPSTGSASCTNCQAGTFSGAQATSCSQCPVGRFSGNQASGCTNCQAGRFASNTGSPTCAVCPEGRRQPSTGQSACIICAAGFFQGSTGQTSCSAAPAGRYSHTGASSSTACPAGKYSSSTGATSSECDGNCNAGTYCATAGRTSPVGTSCPAGRYGRAGETSNTCTGPCDAGFYCPTGTSQNSQIKCGSGQTHPASRYCPSGRGSPLTVSAGFYTTPENVPDDQRTGQSTCPAGSYCQNGKRVLCPAGRYGASNGLTNSQCSGPCEDGFFCAAGSTSPRNAVCSNQDATRYCVAGQRFTCGPNSYTVPEGPDRSTRTGCQPCPGDEYSCINGIKSEKTKWVDTFCASGQVKQLFVDEVATAESSPVTLGAEVHLEVRTPWNSITYSINKVQQNGRNREGGSCSSEMSEWPFDVATKTTTKKFEGIDQRLGDLQVASGKVLRFETCDQFDVTLGVTVVEPGGVTLTSQCTIRVVVQHVNSPPFKLPQFGPLSESITLEAVRGQTFGEPVDEPIGVQFSDPDLDELSFRLVDSDGTPYTGPVHPFSLGVCSGQFSVSNAALLSSTSALSYTLHVVVSDNYPETPGEIIQEVQINIIQPNRPPIVNEEMPALFVIERVDSGTRVYTFGDLDGTLIPTLVHPSLVTDPDGDVITVSMRACQTETYCKAFDLTPDGVLTVSDNRYLDYRFPGDIPRFLRVRYTDGENDPVDAFFQVIVQQLRLAPTIATTSFTIGETATGVIGYLVGFDEHGETFEFTVHSIVNNLGIGENRINVGSAGELSIETGSSFESIQCAEGCTGCQEHDTRISLVVTAEVLDRSDNMPGPIESKPTTVHIDITVVNQPPLYVPPEGDIIFEELKSGPVEDLSKFFCDREDHRMFFELIESTDSHLFSIGGISGILEVRSGFFLNYETKQTHTVNVRVQDNGNPVEMTSQQFTIHVVDVPEPPVLNTNLLQVDELTKSTAGAFGSLDVIDVDSLAGSGLPYSSTPSVFEFIQLSMLEKFMISSSGNIYIAEGYIPDYETLFPNHILEVSVKIRDIINDVETIASFEVEILDVDEPPRFVPAHQEFGVAMHASDGDSIGNMNAVDPDFDSILSFGLDSGPSFLLLTSSGALILTDSDTANLAEGEVYNFTATVSDLTGLTHTSWHTIVVTNPPEAPTWGSMSPEFQVGDILQLSVDEHHSGVISGFQPHCEDPNGGGVIYQLLGTVPSIYADIIRVQQQSGFLQILDPQALDFETLTQTNVELVVACVDSFGLRVEGKIHLEVIDIDEKPEIRYLPSDFVISTEEDSEIGLVLHQFTAFDQDSSSRFALSFRIFAQGILESPILAGQVIYSADGHVGEANGSVATSLDFFAQNSYDMVLEVEDEAGLKDTKGFKFLVIHVNQAPKFSASSFAISVFENATNADVLVASFPFTDRDIGDEHTFEVAASTLPDVFEFRGTELRLLPGKSLDYESLALHELTIRVIDQDGLFDEASFSLSVLNVNDLEISSVDWLEHSTTGGSMVTLSGKNFGPVWADSSISANMISEDESLVFEASCRREQNSSSSLWINTVMECAVPPGIGKDLRWFVEIDGDSHNGPKPITSYEPPQVIDVPSASWPNPANTEGEQIFVVQGKGFGPSTLQGIDGVAYDTPVTVYYRSSRLTQQILNAALLCSVLDDETIECKTSPGVGTELEFYAEIGSKSSSWTQISDWTTPSQVIGYESPLITAVLVLQSEIPTSGVISGVGLVGKQFGNSLNHISASMSNGEYTFESACRTLFNHSYIECDFPPGIGKLFHWTITVGDQLSPSSIDSVSYDPPALDSVLDIAQRIPRDMDTEGNQIVELRGKNFGTHQQNENSISVEYGVDGEIRARDCEVVSVHTRIRCVTSPGVGKDHSWTVIVGYQSSKTLEKITNYHPPVVATYRRPGAPGLGVDDLLTDGNETILLGGRYFGLPGTKVEKAVYGSGNVSFTVKECIVEDQDQIRCITAPGAGSGHFWSVTIGEQESQLATTSYMPPKITGFRGAGDTDVGSLHTQGGQTIYIDGTNFGPPSMSSLFLDSVSYGETGTEYAVRNCLVVSDTEIECQTLRGFGQMHRWLVIIAGQASELSLSTTSYAAPKLLSITPSAGPTGPKSIQVVLEGTDLGAELIGMAEVVVHIDNTGTINRLLEEGKIANVTDEVQDFLSIQQQDPSTATSRAEAEGLPVEFLTEWINGLTKVSIAGPNVQLVEPASRLQRITFSFPTGFGVGRAVFVKVGKSYSTAVWFNYDRPAIANVAPSLPIPGTGMIRVVIDGENFCGGKSCELSTCCGKLYVNNGIIEVDPDSYGHKQIIVFVPASLSKEERFLHLQVLDHPLATNAVAFDVPAPSISGQSGFIVWPKFSTEGGELFKIFDARGIADSVDDNPNIEITVNSRPCTDVTIVSVRQEGDGSYANVTCRMPSNVGQNLPVFVAVDGLSSPNGEMVVSYAGPTVCFVTSEDEDVVLYRNPQLSTKCQEQFTALTNKQMSGSIGLPAAGGAITLHGFNFGADDIPGVDGTISVENLLSAGIPPRVHSHTSVVVDMPPGAGGALTGSSGRLLSDGSGALVAVFHQSQDRFTGSDVSFTYSYNPPSISSIDPDVLPTLPSDDLILHVHGSDFGPPTGSAASGLTGWQPNIAVTIGGAECLVLWSNDTVIACKPPSGQGNNIPLTVTVEGQIVTEIIRFHRARLDSLHPLECPTSGLDEHGIVVNVTILGSNFGTWGDVSIENAHPIPRENLVFSHNQVVFPCPEGSGENLRVTVLVGGWINEAGYVNTLTLSYEAPIVTGYRRLNNDYTGALDCAPFERCSSSDGTDRSFCVLEHPDCFPTQGGVPIEVTGRNFGLIVFNTVRTFIGNLLCVIDSEMLIHQTHNRLICSLPTGVGADLPVQVQIGGRLSSPDAHTFSYDPPRISSVMPNTPDAEGEQLLFRGSNFGPAGGPVSIHIGLVQCASSFVRGHDSVECVTQRDIVGAKSVNMSVANRDVVFPEWMELVVTQCRQNWYGMEGEECLFCPSDARGAVCPGGERVHDLIFADEGWWRINETEPFERCHKKRQHRERCPTFLPCEPKWSCLGNNECSTGYIGTRCSKCVEGSYFRINGECQKCPDNAWLLGVGLAVVAIAGAVGGYIINTKNIQLAAFTIGIDYFQVLAMFARSRVQWPKVMQDTLTILSFFNFNLELAAPECYLSPSPPFELKWMVTMAMPLAIFSLLGFVYLLHYLYKLLVLKAPAKKRHTHLNALIASFLIVMYILYLFLTRMTLDVFNCAPSDPPDGKLYMSGMTDIVCGESSVHVNLLVPLAVLTLVIYVSAFPIMSYWLLRKNKERVKHDQILRAHNAGWSKLSNPNYDFRKRFQRLYYLFKPGKWYWVILILLRKFLIALTSLMFRSSPSYQLAMSLLVIFSAYALQVKHEPYLSPKDYQFIVQDHMQKVAAGDGLHTRIQALMDETKNKNQKEVKKAEGWATAEKAAKVAKRVRPHSGPVVNMLLNYNTVETVLLGAAILVNLAGIMFLSGRFQGEQRKLNEGEFELLGVLTMVVVVLSCVYFFAVFGFELFSTFKPSKATSCLIMLSPKKYLGSPQVSDKRISETDTLMDGTKFNPLLLSRADSQNRNAATAVPLDDEMSRLKEELNAAREEVKALKKERHRLSVEASPTKIAGAIRTTQKQQYGQYMISSASSSSRRILARQTASDKGRGKASESVFDDTETKT